LGHFSKSEKEQMEDGYKNAIEAIEMILQGEIDTAMNQFNKKVVREE
jgi:PTH1 family peptidyl-tRNA hydrolase